MKQIPKEQVELCGELIELWNQKKAGKIPVAAVEKFIEAQSVEDREGMNLWFSRVKNLRPNDDTWAVLEGLTAP